MILLVIRFHILSFARTWHARGEGLQLPDASASSQDVVNLENKRRGGGSLYG